MPPREKPVVASVSGAGIPAPLQARTRAAQARVLAAAMDIFRLQGLEALTVAAVAEAASVSVGSIYRRFENKDVLVRAVHDHWATTVEREIDEVLRACPAGIDSVVGATAAYLLSMTEASAGVFAELDKVTGQDPFIRARAQLVETRVLATFRRAMSPNLGDIGRDDPELAIETAYLILRSLLVTRADFLAAPPRDWAIYAREAAEAVVLYLRGRADPR